MCRTSPNSKAIVPSATISSTPVPGSSTPGPNFGVAPGPFSLTSPSPSAILAASSGANNSNGNHATPPQNISRPGSSAIISNPGNVLIGAGGGVTGGGGLGRFPDLASNLYDFSMGAMGSSLDNSMSLINDYEMGRASKDEPLTLPDSTFDIMSWVNDNLNTDDDVSAVVGGGGA